MRRAEPGDGSTRPVHEEGVEVPGDDLEAEQPQLGGLAAEDGDSSVEQQSSHFTPSKIRSHLEVLEQRVCVGSIHVNFREHREGNMERRANKVVDCSLVIWLLA